jgi:hypothetical protein
VKVGDRSAGARGAALLASEALGTIENEQPSTRINQ